MLDGTPAPGPGLQVLGTDTGVGKTRVACLIAKAIRLTHPGARVGPLKPAASGCTHDGPTGRSEDADALRSASGTDLPDDVVCPVRYRLPLAPGVAAQRQGGFGDGWARIHRALEALTQRSDVVLVEGIGGVQVPMDAGDRATRRPPITVLDFAAALGWPAVVVARPSLGTLNHTALTVDALRLAGVGVIGLIVHAMPQGPSAVEDDPSLADNVDWLSRMSGAPVLTVTPRLESAPDPTQEIAPDDPQLQAVLAVDWLARCRESPRPERVPALGIGSG
ncbi:MAG: dethiobiotin synthase [Planctomycetota bacterium]